MGFQMCPIPSKRKEHQILPWHYFEDVLLVEVLLLSKSFNCWSSGRNSSSSFFKHFSILLCLLNQACQVLMWSIVFLTLMLRKVSLV